MGASKDSTRYMSDLQEKSISAFLGDCARRTQNSGGTIFGAGDVVTKTFLIEAKTQMTEKKSFSIKQEWIEKAREQSFSVNKSHYAIAFNFGGVRNQSENYYIISDQEFKELVEHYERD